MPLVSILICTYNAADTITDTLQSCLQQTYTTIELLIHDDQSTDSTVETIQQIADPRMQLIVSGKKLGAYGGLNFLLEHAKGQYIAIQDHDDLWHPAKLEKQVAFLENNKAYVGCGTKTLMRYEGDQKGFAYYLGKENRYTLHSSVVFRNKGFRYPGGSVYMQDALFQKKILCAGKKLIYNLDETLTLHRIKAGSKNFSYKRFSFTKENIKTLFSLHPSWYACCALAWETMRKIVYPVLQLTKYGNLIDKIERLPFILQGYKMREYREEDVKAIGFILSG